VTNHAGETSAIIARNLCSGMSGSRGTNTHPALRMPMRAVMIVTESCDRTATTAPFPAPEERRKLATLFEWASSSP
jgi:hypothetical protein